MTKIYTKSGDSGDTGLPGGVRVRKDCVPVAACGTLDELNAVLGVARAEGLTAADDQVVATIQHQLFLLGQELASPAAVAPPAGRVGPGQIDWLEQTIDALSELARLTADEVLETERGMMWRVYSSKTRKTRKIPIRREVAERTRQLIATAPPGSGVPLFRNALGGPWNKETGKGRFRRLRFRLGWDQDPVRRHYSTYSCRHTFAHRMLSGYWNDGVGCSIETLAELMGDTPKVAFDHYGREWGQHYQDALWRAIGVR